MSHGKGLVTLKNIEKLQLCQTKRDIDESSLSVGRDPINISPMPTWLVLLYVVLLYVMSFIWEDRR
jgi:hypothetical protein